jgi:pteridine reductase
MHLKGKTAIVTGGAVRVGKAIALALARKGAHVIITYNNSKKAAQETLNQLKILGVEALAVKTDISKLSQVKKLVQTVVKSFGFIDILVNNAAIFYKTPFEKISEKDWDSHIDINLKGTFNCAHQVGMQMLKQKNGKIINIADWAGLRPYKNYIPYCISKAGVICLTQAFAKTLAPHIQVNAVAPGPVLLPPDFDEKEKRQIIEGTPLQKIGSPEDVANTVLFLIEGSDFITGSTYHVDGGRSIV